MVHGKVDYSEHTFLNELTCDSIDSVKIYNSASGQGFHTEASAQGIMFTYNYVKKSDPSLVYV